MTRQVLVRARQILVSAVAGAVLAASLAGSVSAYYSPSPAPHWDNGALCGDLSTLGVVAPSVYGINANAGYDYQPFTWRAVLFRWNGAAWQSVVATSWAPSVWVVDNQALQPQNQTHSFVDFGPGYYRTAIQYYWFAYAGPSGQVPAGSDYRYVGTHYVLHNGSITGSASYCTYT